MLYGCKGVIFDFNGTLFFDSEKHIQAWGRMGVELRGCAIGPEEMQAHFYGVPNNRAIEYLLQKECDEAELTKYSELKESNELERQKLEEMRKQFALDSLKFEYLKSQNLQKVP